MRSLPLLLALALAGCQFQNSESANTPLTPEITVSAAASLKNAFDEISRLYESRTGTKVVFNYGASGVLQKQIENAAPVDVFASAGARQMDALERAGLILPETRRDFARNTLVLIVPHDAAFVPDSLTQLNDSRLQRLAIGNPKTVPAGQYAQQSLVKLGLWPQLASRLVLAEDVRQVLDYVARGEADAGLVYASDVALMRDAVRVVASAPEDSHDPILYPIAVIKDSRQKESAQRFVEFVLSPEGQAILQHKGFQGVSEK